MFLPELPVIDTHVHLWNPQRFKMSWVEGNPVLDRPYEPAEFTAAVRPVEVQAFIFVETGLEPHYAFLEAEWVANLARQEPRLQGLVAAAPLEHGPQSGYYLERLASLGPLVKGVRRLLQSEADPEFCLRPDFIEGVRLLPRFGFSFDICIYHYQLPGVIRLARECPGVSFILDHLAKPAIRQGELEPWRANLAELARLPNVACKISGLVTEADHRNWNAAGLAPYISHALEVFGPERVMFGSDWPVARQAVEYEGWVRTLAELTAHLPPADRLKLWSGNARRWYRL